MKTINLIVVGNKIRTQTSKRVTSKRNCANQTSTWVGLEALMLFFTCELKRFSLPLSFYFYFLLIIYFGTKLWDKSDQLRILSFPKREKQSRALDSISNIFFHFWLCVLAVKLLFRVEKEDDSS